MKDAILLYRYSRLLTWDWVKLCALCPFKEPPLSYLFVIWRTFFHHKEPFVKQKGRLSPRLSIATGGSARDVTHSITSIIQSFVYKCNNSNSCKLFYLDCKSLLIHKLPQTPYMAFPLDWQVWAQKIAYSLFCIQQIYFVMSDIDLVGKPNTTSPIWNHFHSCHPSAFVQVSSSSRDRKRPAGQVCIGEAFRAFTPQAARTSKWPEVIHFQCEPAASSGESGAAHLGWWGRRGELKAISQTEGCILRRSHL